MTLKETNLSIETVILIIAGMTLLITGFLLFPASLGLLPYYENGLYGLLLIVFALQMITLGQTPFGRMRRSKLLVAFGVVIGAIGIITCFIPALNQLPRVILIICLGPGGLFLLLDMCLSKDKLRTWLKYGGIFLHLVFACFGVYVLSMLIAILIWIHSMFVTLNMAILAFIFGVALLYLAWVLQKIYGRYPEAEKSPEGGVRLTTDQAMLILVGVFMLLLGVLLIPVNMGLITFSSSAQLGLLMVIFAIQMLASGSTPIGVFPRSWHVIAFGLLFAAMGIVSCIIPEILVLPLTVLVGVLNILGGLIMLMKISIFRPKQPEKPPEVALPVLARLFRTQLVMNLLAIMFGTSMLVPGLINGLVIGVILAANGGVLLYLLHILTVLDRIRNSMEEAA